MNSQSRRNQWIDFQEQRFRYFSLFLYICGDQFILRCLCLLLLILRKSLVIIVLRRIFPSFNMFFFFFMFRPPSLFLFIIFSSWYISFVFLILLSRCFSLDFFFRHPVPKACLYHSTWVWSFCIKLLVYSFVYLSIHSFILNS